MDIKVLKAEKRALKIKLRRFEDEFIRQNGQKPQSYQEVLSNCVCVCARAAHERDALEGTRSKVPVKRGGGEQKSWIFLRKEFREAGEHNTYYCWC